MEVRLHHLHKILGRSVSVPGHVNNGERPAHPEEVHLLCVTLRDENTEKHSGIVVQLQPIERNSTRNKTERLWNRSLQKSRPSSVAPVEDLWQTIVKPHPSPLWLAEQIEHPAAVWKDLDSNSELVRLWRSPGFWTLGLPPPASGRTNFWWGMTSPRCCARWNTPKKNRNAPSVNQIPHLYAYLEILHFTRCCRCVFFRNSD